MPTTTTASLGALARRNRRLDTYTAFGGLMQVGSLVRYNEKVMTTQMGIGIIATHLVGYEDAYRVKWNNNTITWETERSLEVLCK